MLNKRKQIRQLFMDICKGSPYPQYRWLKALPDRANKDAELKGSLRIHSPDSANNKI